MTPGSFQALWGCSGQCTLVYFCSLLLTVLLPQHVSFTSHIPFWGVFDLTWVLHGLHFLRASLCHSGVLPSGNFQLCSHQYALVQSSKPASLLASSQVLFLRFLPNLFSPFFNFLLSPTPSSWHPSSSTSDQRHSVSFWLIEGLRHDGLSPSFLESSRTFSDWHREAHGTLSPCY